MPLIRRVNHGRDQRRVVVNARIYEHAARVRATLGLEVVDATSFYVDAGNLDAEVLCENGKLYRASPGRGLGDCGDVLVGLHPILRDAL